MLPTTSSLPALRPIQPMIFDHGIQPGLELTSNVIAILVRPKLLNLPSRQLRRHLSRNILGIQVHTSKTRRHHPNRKMHHALIEPFPSHSAHLTGFPQIPKELGGKLDSFRLRNRIRPQDSFPDCNLLLRLRRSFQHPNARSPEQAQPRIQIHPISWRWGQTVEDRGILGGQTARYSGEALVTAGRHVNFWNRRFRFQDLELKRHTPFPRPFKNDPTSLKGHAVSIRPLFIIQKSRTMPGWQQILSVQARHGQVKAFQLLPSDRKQTKVELCSPLTTALDANTPLQCPFRP